MAKQKYFDKFLNNIEPSATTVSYISSIHTNLRDYLAGHEEYKNIHIKTFLSGSYAKHTSIRPVLNDDKRDVDIVVVTNHTDSDNSQDVLQELYDVIISKKIYENATIQSHSIGITMSGIDIDVVPVIEDEAENSDYLKIGSNDEGGWKITDPQGHISWSTTVNKDNSNEYKPLVKIFKWWRRINCPDDIKYPKGITLEKIIADNLGDSSETTENLIIATMQNINDSYQKYIEDEEIPLVNDPTVEGNDLLAGYNFSDFKLFIDKIKEHIDLIENEGTGNDTWRKVLGDEFPKEETKNSIEKSQLINQILYVKHRQAPQWALPRGYAVFIAAQVVTKDGYKYNYENDSDPIPKGSSISFKAITTIKPNFQIYWQVVNTGKEAEMANDLRGGFEKYNYNQIYHSEGTSYTGSHYVQCFIIKNGQCIARSKEFIVNIK